MAQPGGVLTRAGHTEAGCDLARLAGFEPAAVIVEIMNDDGTMARRPELEQFARSHNLKIGTIADLIRYRLRNERSVERISEQNVQTEFGEFRLYMYEDHVQRDVHLALTHGPITDSSVPLGPRARRRHAARPRRYSVTHAGVDVARGDGARGACGEWCDRDPARPRVPA